MNWLKGLVAPAAQYVGQPGPQGPAFDPVPPAGGTPYTANSYGVQPPQAPPIGQPMAAQPPMGGLPDASQWSTGTRTQGAGTGATGASLSGDRGSLEAKCAELQHDVASLALFARTLLTMLEDQKVVTREQFMETKARLDMLDGKMDDR